MRVSSLSAALLIGVAYSAPVTSDDACTPTVETDINESQAAFEELAATAKAVHTAALANSHGACTADKIAVRREWYVMSPSL